MTAISEGVATITVMAVDGNFTANCMVTVKPLPPRVKFELKDNYAYTDSISSVSFSWNISDSGTVTQNITVSKNNVPFTGFTQNGNSIIIQPSSVSGIKDIYSIRVTVTNQYGDSTSDSITFEIYNQDALAVELSSPIVIDNADKIAGKSSDDILGMRGELTISHNLQLNTNNFSWSGMDGLTWQIADESIADVYYLLADGWTKAVPETSVHPLTPVRIIGYKNGSTALTATHKKTGMSVNIPVSVNTLENKLYLIRTTPAQSSQVSYTNSANQTKTLTTNGRGEVAIYEPDSIVSDINIQSDKGDDKWIGTIKQSDLMSGENQSGLYPMNHIKLTLLSNLKLYAMKPNLGGRYQGDVQISGGLFKNGDYISSSEIKGLHFTTDTSGCIVIQLDTDSFGQINPQDNYKYIFEICFLSGNYAPMIIEVDAQYDYREALQSNVFTMYLREWNDKTKPAVSYWYNGKDVTNEKGAIGVTDDNPNGTLIAYVALPNGRTLRSARIKDVADENQSCIISDFQFLTDISYAEIRWKMDKNTVPVGLQKSFDIIFTYTDNSSQTEKIPFSVSNTVGMRVDAEGKAAFKIPFRADFGKDINQLSPLWEYNGLNYEVRIKPIEGSSSYEWYGYYTQKEKKPKTLEEFLSNYASVKSRINKYLKQKSLEYLRIGANLLLFNDVDMESYVEGLLVWSDAKQEFELHITDGNMIGEKRPSPIIDFTSSWEWLDDLKYAIRDFKTGDKRFDIPIKIIELLIPSVEKDGVEYTSSSIVSMKKNNSNEIELSLEIKEKRKTIPTRLTFFSFIKINMGSYSFIDNWYAKSKFNINTNESNQIGWREYSESSSKDLNKVVLWGNLSLYNSIYATQIYLNSLDMSAHDDSFILSHKVFALQNVALSELPGNEDVIIAGDENFAVATWESLTSDLSQEYLNELADTDEIELNDLINLMNQTEIFVSVYDGSSWSEPLALTDNGQPDVSPVIAVHNGKAVVIWQRLMLQNNGEDEINAQTELWHSIYNGNDWSEPVQLDYFGENGGSERNLV